MSRSVPLQVSQPAESKNTCGECTACCDILGIPELGKPFYSRCTHLILNKGCGIYADRPTACVAFRCAWHAGVLGESIDRRPDHNGLMFDLCPSDNPPRLNVWETIPGALQRENLSYLIKKVREHKALRSVRLGHPAVILFPYGSKMGIPFEIADSYHDWKAPVSPTMQLRPSTPNTPDVALFAGEIEPLHMPSKLSSPPDSTAERDK